MAVLAIRLEGNDAGSVPIHLLARKKKKDEKVRIIFDRRRAMKRRSFPYDHHRQEERTIWWSVLKRFWPHFFLLSLSA